MLITGVVVVGETMSLRTYFIYTNVNGFHEDIFSFGLASIVAMTKRHGHDAKWVTVKTKADYKWVLDEIKSYKPHVVGFTAVSSQFSFVKELSKAIKESDPKILTVCGGVHPTIAPTCLVDAKYLDSIFVGEADFAFAEFLEKVDAGEDYKTTDNLAYVIDGKLIRNQLKKNIPELDVLPFGDRETGSFQETLKSIGYAPYLFARGCPYSCTYCSNQAIAEAYGIPKNYARYRSAESSIQEIEYAMERYPVKAVYVGDDIFGLNKKWREEFCTKYKERINLDFYCLLRPDLVNKAFLELLAYAGCKSISLGLEAGNEHVRNNIMNRRMTQETIIRAFKLVHSYGIQTNAINIIGTPGENDAAIWDTIKLNRLVKPTSTGANIFYPYEGTALGDYCFDNNLVDLESFDSFSNERRESILAYSEEFKSRLLYYRENWDVLVYPYDFKRRIMKYVRKTFLWKLLRDLKNGLMWQLKFVRN